MLQEFIAYCTSACKTLYQCSVTLKVHQICFSPGLRPGPRWGAQDAPQTP